ncbi:MAG: ABC transporter ATP-binding protein [Anaerovoracaceae bacterium]|jgi:ATP-binding cassette subfamily B multidrug efflux pump
MSKIFKYLRRYWLPVLIVALLLVVQAYCDLSLPQYMSDIIDVGITNKGVSHIVPEKITQEEYDYAEMFMNSSEKSTWENAFEEEDGIYVRKTDDEEQLDKLDEKLQLPLLMNYGASHMSESQFKEVVSDMLSSQASATGQQAPDIEDMSVDEIAAMLGINVSSFEEEDENGKTNTYVDVRPMLLQMVQSGSGSEVISQLRESTSKTIDSMGSSIITSMGSAYAAAADEDAGIDMDALQMKYMWSVGLKMGIMSLIMLAAAVLTAYAASGIGAAVGRNMRSEIFHRVMSFSDADMEKFSTASLITRSTNDIQQIQLVIVFMLRVLLYAPILGIGGIYKVVQTGASMEWIIILAVVCIIVFVSILMGATLKKFKIMQKLIDALNLVSREILTGLSVIRAFGREKEESRKFDKANRDLADTQLFTSRAMTFMFPGMSLIMYGTTLLIVWVASHRIDDGELQIGQMTAFITYAMMIVMSFLMLTMISIFLPRAGVAAERIDEVITTEPSIREPENPEHVAEKKGVVRFNNVGFAYPDAEDEVISDISFTAEPGTTTAFIGSTGSGKSSLINLVPRFYDVTRGSVTIDGVDIRKMPIEELRSMIGFVPQKGTLFSGTIASNLRFGDENATDDELREAADIAQATEFIDEKPEGLETHIAQGGSNVSGGQKQRLAIARAIVKKPEIFIFDDSFSALDMKTDAELRKAFAEKSGASTVMIVAQRVSTIMHADQIIVLDEGRMVGQGTHEELLRSCSVYRDIAKSQLSSKELNLGMEE